MPFHRVRDTDRGRGRTARLLLLPLLTGSLAASLSLPATAATRSPAAPRAAAGRRAAAAPADISWAQRQPARVFSTPVYTHKYTANTPGESFSSVAVGDVTGSGRPDVVAGFPDGTVWVWDAASGTTIDTYQVGAGAVEASPTLVDLNHDGVADILATTISGDISAYSLRGGHWSGIFHAYTGNHRADRPDGNFATPTVADINRDGYPDIVETGWDRYLHVWDGRHLSWGGPNPELPGFPYFFTDTSWSSPAVADVNGDGWPDIVVGYDCDGVYGQPCWAVRDYYQRGGYLTVIDHTARPLRGWPRFVSGQTVWSSPAVADLEGNGRPDIVVGTGNDMAGGHEVLAYRADGSYVPGWPRPVAGDTMSSPVVADVTGDGHPDVLITDDTGHLYLFNRSGGLTWSACVTNSYPGGCPKRLHQSPVVGDLLGNGTQQMVVGAEQHLLVFDRAGSMVYSALAPFRTPSVPFSAAPTIATVDGQAWVFEAAGPANQGQVYAWTLHAPAMPSAWPTFHQNAGRTGSTWNPAPGTPSPTPTPTPPPGPVPPDRWPPTIVLYPVAPNGLRPKVTWGSSDLPYGTTASGVASFDVWMREDSGPFRPWLLGVHPVFRSSTFAAGSGWAVTTPGHTWTFVARAHDRAGNTSPWSHWVYTRT